MTTIIKAPLGALMRTPQLKANHSHGKITQADVDAFWSRLRLAIHCHIWIARFIFIATPICLVGCITGLVLRIFHLKLFALFIACFSFNVTMAILSIINRRLRQRKIHTFLQNENKEHWKDKNATWATRKHGCRSFYMELDSIPVSVKQEP